MYDFKTFLESLSLKKTTIYRHLCALRIIKRISLELDKQTLLDWFALVKEKYTNSYKSSMSSTIRRYGQWQDREELKHFPMYGKKTHFVKTTMTMDEIKSFLELSPPVIKRVSKYGTVVIHQANPKRHNLWTLYFKILAYTGMRTGEVAKLTKKDVDFGRLIFTLGDTKTNDFRLVPIPNFLLEEIKEHIKKLKTDRLFPGFDDVDWHYNFHTRIKRLGINRTNLTPYSLRHSFITRMIEKNVNLFNIQAIVGHKNIKTTAQYVHLTVEPLRAILNDQ